MITLCILLSIAILAGIIRLLLGVVAVTGRITFALLAPVFIIIFGAIIVAKFFFKLLFPLLVVIGIAVLIKNIIKDNK